MTDINEIEKIKAKFPEGTRIKLGHMDDPYTPIPDEMTGTVMYVDDRGQIGVKWDNGRLLALLPDVDTYEIIKDKIREKITARDVAEYFKDNGYEGQAANKAYCEALAEDGNDLYDAYAESKEVPYDAFLPEKVEIIEEIVAQEIKEGFKDYYAFENDRITSIER